MTREKLNPTIGRGRVPKMFNCLATVNVSDDSSHSPKTQEFRANWLARRAGISINLAATIAPLAFGWEGDR